MGDLAKALGAAHVMDLVVAATILGMAVFGFTKGTLKLLMIALAVMVGFVLASIFYEPFARIIAPFFGLRISEYGHENDLAVANSTSFALVNIVVALLLGFLMFSFFGHLEVRGRFGSCLDKPLGMMMGFIAGIFIAGILVTLISVPYELVSNLALPGQEGQAGTILHQWYVDSWLGTPLRCGIMPYVLGVLQAVMTVPNLLIGRGC